MNPDHSYFANMVSTLTIIFCSIFLCFSILYFYGFTYDRLCFVYPVEVSCLCLLCWFWILVLGGKGYLDTLQKFGGYYVLVPFCSIVVVAIFVMRVFLCGQSPGEGGSLFGEHNVLINCFEQNQAGALHLDKRVPEIVTDVVEVWRLDDIKGLLGQYSFRTAMLVRKVSGPSGDEKVRFSCSKIILQPSTLLIMDEPTNLLDISTKEMLEEVIIGYQGTVIMGSHDRYLLKQLVTRVLEIKEREAEFYETEAIGLYVQQFGGMMVGPLATELWELLKRALQMGSTGGDEDGGLGTPIVNLRGATMRIKNPQVFELSS